MNGIIARTFIVGLILTVISDTWAFGPTTGKITYQGQLKLGATAVDEACEAIFTLYDAETGGNVIAEVGSPAAPHAVQVARGLFTTSLDFGDGAFNGDERWLEISVRLQSLGGAFTTLTPRQSLTATPYALHAKTGGAVSLEQAYNTGGPGAGRTIQANAGPLSIEGPDGLRVSGSVGIGVANPTARLEVAGTLHVTEGGIRFPDGTLQTTAQASALVGSTTFWDDNTVNKIFTAPGVVGVGIGVADPLFTLDVGGTSRVSGNAVFSNDVDIVGTLGATLLFADQITTLSNVTVGGTLNADFVNANSPLSLQSDGVTGIFLDGTPTTGTPGFVAIGRTSPQEIPASLLHLAANAENPIITLEMDPNNNGTPSPRFAGLQFLTSNAAANTFLGEITLEESSGSLFIESATGHVILSELNGNVGIGTDAPLAKLEVVGAARVTNFQMTSGAANGFVLTSDAAGNATWTAALANPTGPAGGDLTGNYPNPDIAANAVTSAEIADNSVGNSEMADDAIGNAELQDNAVGLAEMQDNSVGSAEIIDDSITSADIGPGAITGADIANDSITNVQLASDPLSLNKVSGGVMQSTVGNIDIPAPGILFVDFISSHSPLQLITNTPVPVVRVHINDGTDPLTAGFVGIGITTPATKLHVAGGSDLGGGGGFLQLGDPAGLSLKLDDNEIQSLNVAAPSNLFLNRLGAKVVVGPSLGGNLGIGNVDPTTALDIFQPQAVARLVTNTVANGSVVELRNLSGAPNFLGAINFNNLGGTTPGQISYTGDDQMLFVTSSVIRARIDAAGNVGIGIAVPLSLLHVNGDGRFEGTVFTDSVSSPTAVDPLELEINGVPHIRIQANGQVGIGAPPPAVVDPDPAHNVALEVAGCVKATCFIATNTTGIPVSPLNLVKLGTSGITLNPTQHGTVIVRPTATGVQKVMLPLNLPTQLLGTTQRLSAFRICYRTANGSSPITEVRVKQLQDSGVATVPFSDVTPRLTPPNSFQCDDLPVAPPVVLSGPTYLELTLNFIGTGTLHDIEIGKVTADLTN